MITQIKELTKSNRNKNISNPLKIVITTSENQQTHVGDFERSLSDIRVNRRNHQDFLVSAELSKIYSKQKDVLHQQYRRQLDTLVDQNRELKGKLVRIRDKVMAGVNLNGDSFKKLFLEILNQVREVDYTREELSYVAGSSQQ